MAREDIGSVATLWRFPVKSMGGEQVQEVEITRHGILGDCSYALIDKDTGKVVSAKGVRLFPNLLDCKIFAELGMESPVPAGSFFDVFPLSVLTTSTLSRLNEVQPKSRFDQRRFRMNVIVKTVEDGFVENGWVGREVGLGEEVRLNVALLDPRCVMTTLAQDELPKDTNVLRSLVDNNRAQLGDPGLLPCAGVYAERRASYRRCYDNDSVNLKRV